jgi:hypothetical protein
MISRRLDDRRRGRFLLRTNLKGQGHSQLLEIRA